jgi:site-specific recombinase XerD
MIKPSQVEAWLSKHYGHLSASSYNSALTVVRDSLNLALRDRIIAESPAAHLQYRKRERPIRLSLPLNNSAQSSLTSGRNA